MCCKFSSTTFLKASNLSHYACVFCLCFRVHCVLFIDPRHLSFPSTCKFRQYLLILGMSLRFHHCVNISTEITSVFTTNPPFLCPCSIVVIVSCVSSDITCCTYHLLRGGGSYTSAYTPTFFGLLENSCTTSTRVRT